MLNRRTCLALPLLAAVPAWAAPRIDVSEVRLALPAGQSAHLGVPVRITDARGAGVVAALDRGHLEGAVLTPALARSARSRMGARLATLGPRADGMVPVVRRALPPGLRQAIGDALSA